MSVPTLSGAVLEDILARLQRLEDQVLRLRDQTAEPDDYTPRYASPDRMPTCGFVPMDGSTVTVGPWQGSGKPKRRRKAKATAD